MIKWHRVNDEIFELVTENTRSELAKKEQKLEKLAKIKEMMRGLSQEDIEMIMEGDLAKRQKEIKAAQNAKAEWDGLNEEEKEEAIYSR